MTRLIDLPDFVKIRHQNFWIKSSSGSAGRGLDGRETIAVTENRYWVARVDFPPMTPRQRLAVTVIGDQLRGRANVFRVPVCNQYTPRDLGSAAQNLASVGVSPASIAAGSLPYSDGQRFSDGTGFALPDFAAPRAAATGAVGASVIVLDGFLGRNLSAGAFFAVNDFLYRVEGNVDGVVRFNPPLREAVAVGAAVEVSNPHGRFRLADDDGWQVFADLDYLGNAFSVELEEVFERA